MGPSGLSCDVDRDVLPLHVIDKSYLFGSFAGFPSSSSTRGLMNSIAKSRRLVSAEVLVSMHAGSLEHSFLHRLQVSRWQFQTNVAA